VLGAVDCLTFGTADPVQVTGFSSGAAPPCAVAGTGCTVPAPEAREPAALAAPVLPSENAFLPARPNPFGGSTELAFAVKSEAHVRLDVYDVRGRLVRSLADGVMSSGQYARTWDGRAATGERAAAGVYFARVEIGDFRMTRSIVLVGTGN
jgi:hypothetical protein